MLKNVIILLAIITALCFSTACKKCATCTYYDEAIDSTFVSEFCGKGNIYKDQLKQHEDNKYECSED